MKVFNGRKVIAFMSEDKTWDYINRHVNLWVLAYDGKTKIEIEEGYPGAFFLNEWMVDKKDWIAL